MKFVLEVTGDYWEGRESGSPPVDGAYLHQVDIDRFTWCIDIDDLDGLVAFIASLDGDHPTIRGCQRQIVVGDTLSALSLRMWKSDGEYLGLFKIREDFPVKYAIEIYNDYRE